MLTKTVSNGIVNFTIASGVGTLFSKSLLYILDAKPTAANISMEKIRTKFKTTDRNKGH